MISLQYNKYTQCNATIIAIFQKNLLSNMVTFICLFFYCQLKETNSKRKFYNIIYIHIYFFSEVANWGQCTCLNKQNRFLIHLHPISESFNGICCPCQMKQCDEKENVFCTVAHLCNIYKLVVSMMVLCLLIILQDFSGIFPLVKLIKCCP